MPQHHSKYSQEVRDEAIRRMETGESKASVARALGMHADSLRNWAPHIKPLKRTAPYPDDVRKEVIRRVKAGQSKASAAKALGIAAVTAEKWTPKTRQPTKGLRYSKEVRDEAVRRVEAGESRASVAQSLGPNASTISNWTSHVELRTKPTPPDLRRQALERVRNGESALAVERDLGVPSQSIGKWLRREIDSTSPAQAKAIQQAYTQGKTRRTIALELRISIRAVNKALTGHNSTPKYNHEVKRTAVEAIEGGASVSDVAKQLGCTFTTVRSWHKLAIAAGTAKELLARPPKLKDVACEWISRSYPHLEAWRPLAAGWLQGETSNFGKAVQAITFFIERYLDALKLPCQPADLLRKDVPLPDFFKVVCTESPHGVDLNNKAHLFLEWVLRTPAFSLSETSHLSSAFRNPIPYVGGNRFARIGQSNKKVIAYGLIAKLRSFLAGGPHFRDWVLAQSLLGVLQIDGSTTGNDWFEVPEERTDKNDPDCVWRVRKRVNSPSILEMWSPVRWVVILMKLQTPARTGQWRLCDSGEADTYVYRNGSWTRNTGPLAKGTTRAPWRQGVLRQVPTSTMEQGSLPILYFNTNKTNDLGKRGTDKGQECPWIHSNDIFENPYYWVERLRNWQEKYNPIQAHLAWIEVPTARQLSAMSDTQKANYPDVCFLFRTPETPGETQFPTSNGHIDYAWQRLIKAFEEDLSKSGEAHEDGSRIILFDQEAKRAEILLHGLRVSLITHFIVDGGMPPELMMKIVGHARLIMIVYYTKPGMSDIRDALSKAHLRLDATKDSRLTESLRNAKAEKIRDHVVFNSDEWTTVLPVHPADRSPLGWLYMFDGICLAGGNTGPLDGNASVPGCHNGGSLMRQSTNEYSPVPGGLRNCPRCRWKCAGKEHGNALRATLNNRFYHLHVQEEKAINADRSVQALKIEKARAEAAGLIFEKMRELKAASRVYEQAMVRVGDLASDIAALNRTIERVKALPQNSNGTLALALQADVSTMHTILEETSSELLQLSGICEDVEFYPDLDPGVAVFERAQLLDKALEREGHPPYFARLSQEESLLFGNAFMQALERQANPENPIMARRQVVDLIDGHQSLEQILNIKLSSLLPLTSCEKIVIDKGHITRK